MTIKRKFPRSSAVLMPLNTLYGPFGIGVMGEEARGFIDFLCDSGFHGWQILPIEHAGMCNSPYRCISTYAGEPMLIDPRMLLDMGLINENELSARMEGVDDDFVDYDIVREKQWDILRVAFSRVKDSSYGSYREFNPFWLDDYSLFLSIRHHFNNEAWFNWPHEGLRSHDKSALDEYRQKLSNDIEFHQFVQWLFDMQWTELREYATDKGISIIGDTPIYVSDDSVEVWSRRELFNADADGTFRSVGGVPPDYFAVDGQRWGNPIYNWDLLKEENYSWWVDRIKGSLDRYDVVRLDHFRGFEQYWDIPGDAPTAKTGKWEDGPGIALFNVLEDALGDLSLSIIAEDLGIIDDRVEALVKNSGFRGMRVMQFGFLGDEVNLPHNYIEETTAYTGTHDNTTLLAWFFELSEEERNEALFYAGFNGDWSRGGANSPIICAWIRILFMSASSLAVVPIQDILGYGADTRTNTPGTATGNWLFRIREGVLNDVNKDFYIALHKTFQREDPVKSFKPQEKVALAWEQAEYEPV